MTVGRTCDGQGIVFKVVSRNLKQPRGGRVAHCHQTDRALEVGSYRTRDYKSLSLKPGLRRDLPRLWSPGTGGNGVFPC